MSDNISIGLLVNVLSGLWCMVLSYVSRDFFNHLTFNARCLMIENLNVFYCCCAFFELWLYYL